MRYAIIAVMAALLASPGVFAEDSINSSAGLNLSIGGGYVVPDNDRNLDGDPVGVLGIGYRFGPHWGVEVRGAFNNSLDANGAGSNGKLRHYRLDAIYNFLNGRWQPYLSGGVSQSNYHYSRANGTSDTQLSYGGGLKYFVTPNVFLRGDVRGLTGESSNTTDGLFSLSVGYLFGQSTAAAPAAAPVSRDSDGDGVADHADRCPDTPAGAPVDADGCALDSDHDGVPDYRDNCPDTKPGAKVDERGCYVVLKKQVSFRLHVAFPLNSARIPAQYDSRVAELARFLKQYPQTDVTVEGHTDSTGQAAYNKSLSQKRAEAVVNRLVAKYGISRDRLTPIGYGETRPIADNSTAAGRAQNRRVVAVIKATVKQQQ